MVIALLSWFHLVSRAILMSAQLNEVLADDLWPRRLLVTSPPTDADRRATMLDVQRIQRDPRLAVSADAPESRREVEVAGQAADLEQPLHAALGARSTSAGRRPASTGRPRRACAGPTSR